MSSTHFNIYNSGISGGTGWAFGGGGGNGCSTNIVGGTTGPQPFRPQTYFRCRLVSSAPLAPPFDGRWYPISMLPLGTDELWIERMSSFYPPEELLYPLVSLPVDTDLSALGELQKKMKTFLSEKGRMDFSPDTLSQVSDLLNKVKKAKRPTL